MPSFLSKVFLRKKSDEGKQAPKPELLEGKYEAVAAPSSPSDSVNDEKGDEKEKETNHDGFGGLALFRTKSKNLQNQARATAPSAPKAPVPALSLKLPSKADESKDLGTVFDERQVSLDDATIGAKRLTPAEALVLVKACSAIIEQRGLETLGVMHPHWHSASLVAQRKLISLFVQSLAETSATHDTSSASSKTSAFDSELEYTRSVYDVAAVLRWGLRHLELDGGSFGKAPAASDEWTWYSTFSQAEKDGAYPPKAFSELLVPQIPTVHKDLLGVFLNLASSLAAHAEYNGISGSKFSKFLGLWLLSAKRADGAEDWLAFYQRFDRAGRILEHLFLADIRDEAVGIKMPKRLRELVNNYPYTKYASESDNGLLPRPRFSTRRHDALFVRITTELPSDKQGKVRLHPFKLVEAALESQFYPVENDVEESAGAVWTEIRKAASDKTDTDTDLLTGASSIVSHVVADDTLRLFNLLPAGEASLPSPSVTIMSPRGRSASSPVDIKGKGKATNGSSAHGKAATSPTKEYEAFNIGDWSQFSSAGFGSSNVGSSLASTLLDNEVEVSQPPVKRRFSQRRTGSRRSSVDQPPSTTGAATVAAAPPVPSAKVTTTFLELTLVDEAFVDFYSDAFVDPITANWPSFALCQLKPLPGLKDGEKTVVWLVIEHVYSVAPPPEPTPVDAPSPPRASSPRPSNRSNTNTGSVFSSARKRFTFFGGNSSTDIRGTGSSNKKTSTKVGELGEIVHEEEEKHEPKAEESAEAPAATSTGISKAELATAGAGAVALGAAVVAAAVDEKQNTDESTKTKTETQAVHTNGAANRPIAEEPVSASNEASLPPAPEPVVQSGETPGPQLALATSESEALEDPSTRVVSEDEAEPTPDVHTDASDPATASEDVTPLGSEPVIAPIAEDTTADSQFVTQEPVPVIEEPPAQIEQPIEERESVAEEPASQSAFLATVQEIPTIPTPADEPAMTEGITPVTAPAEDITPLEESVPGQPAEAVEAVEETTTVIEEPAPTFAEEELAIEEPAPPAVADVSPEQINESEGIDEPVEDIPVAAPVEESTDVPAEVEEIPVAPVEEATSTPVEEAPVPAEEAPIGEPAHAPVEEPSAEPVAGTEVVPPAVEELAAEGSTAAAIDGFVSSTTEEIPAAPVDEASAEEAPVSSFEKIVPIVEEAATAGEPVAAALEKLTPGLIEEPTSAPVDESTAAPIEEAPIAPEEALIEEHAGTSAEAAPAAAVEEAVPPTEETSELTEAAPVEVEDAPVAVEETAAPATEQPASVEEPPTQPTEETPILPTEEVIPPIEEATAQATTPGPLSEEIAPVEDSGAEFIHGAHSVPVEEAMAEPVQEPVAEEPVVPHEEPTSEVAGEPANAPVEELSSHTTTTTNADTDAEEPSMEALLASGGGGSWGAEAWENVPAGMTVKRIVRPPIDEALGEPAARASGGQIAEPAAVEVEDTPGPPEPVAEVENLEHVVEEEAATTETEPIESEDAPAAEPEDLPAPQELEAGVVATEEPKDETDAAAPAAGAAFKEEATEPGSEEASAPAE